jgi:beta-ribofuranosylaminobenzene 5'-phosphate synthase
MSEPAPLTLEGGSRLHLGLWAWGASYQRQFGGVGLMAGEPQLRLRIEAAERFEATGPTASRVKATAESCVRYFGWSELPACRIKIEKSPPQHVGLGVGTQTDLAVARGLALWQGRSEPTIAELALAVDRGGRSSVGTHGFDRGGLIIEAGRGPGDTLGELLHHVPLPEAWRILLLMPRQGEGLSGKAEREAFASLPDVPWEVHRELVRLACDEMVPAARESQFERFASALYEYGLLAGSCYQGVQATPYYSPDGMKMVDRLRASGVAGVAQSSWGPTLFALLPSDESASSLSIQMKEWKDLPPLEVILTHPLNEGARAIFD